MEPVHQEVNRRLSKAARWIGILFVILYEVQ